MSRHNLTNAIEARESARTTMHAAEAALSRLAKAQDGAIGPAAELALLDAEESAAILEWSRAEDAGDPPTPDVKRRAAIEGRVAKARATAEAARRAVEPKSAEHNVAARAVADAERAVKAAAAAVLFDEVAGLAEEHRRATTALARITLRIDAGRHALLMAAHAVNRDGMVDDLTRPLFMRLETLNAELASANPDALTIAAMTAAEGARFADLLSRLAHDAGASLTESN